MKAISRTVLLVLVTAIPSLMTAQDEKAKENVTVKFETSIDCQNCVNTIMKNIPFEKGVKDVKCDLPTKVVTISYNPEKTNAPALKRAIEKLGYTAREIKPKN